MLKTVSNPLDFLTAWDFILLLLGVWLKMSHSMYIKSCKYVPFSFTKYFDVKHLIRWNLHVVSSIVAILSFPQLFVTYIQPKYFEEMTGWLMVFSAVIGFTGYYFWKSLEIIVLFFAKKIGVSSEWLKRIGINILIISLSLNLSGCFMVSKDLRKKKRALKKIERAKKLAPELFTADTVLIIDTVFTEEVKHDTITKIQYHDSTIIVNNDRVFAKYYYDTLRQEIFHEIQCKSDTVIFNKQIEVEKFRSLTMWENTKLNLPYLLLILSLIIFLLYNRGKGKPDT